MKERKVEELLEDGRIGRVENIREGGGLDDGYKE